MKWYSTTDALAAELRRAGLDLRPADVDPSKPCWETMNCRVSYYPTTGTIQMQGKAGFVASLYRTITEGLKNSPDFEEI